MGRGEELAMQLFEKVLAYRYRRSSSQRRILLQYVFPPLSSRNHRGRQGSCTIEWRREDDENEPRIKPDCKSNSNE